MWVRTRSQYKFNKSVFVIVLATDLRTCAWYPYLAANFATRWTSKWFTPTVHRLKWHKL